MTLTSEGKTLAYRLDSDRRTFVEHSEAPLPPVSLQPCRKLHPRLVTFDLRLA
jgi:hypothetical protein